MDVVPISTPGLGDTSYVVNHEEVSLIVDPQRDAERFVAAATGVVTHVLETHIHNDYISGGRTAAGVSGGELVLPAASGAAFAFTPAFHNEALHANGLTIRPLHTPGHTPEHVAYVVHVDEVPAAIFTGGSMLVDAAGRSDLLGMDRAEQLARLQYWSLQRLLELPDDVAVYPTHGSGSFCSSTVAVSTTSTIGEQRQSSPVLQYDTEDEFVTAQLAGLQPYPTYYAFMGPINAAGPEPISRRKVPVWEPDDVAGRDEDIHVLDVRPRDRYAAAHIPGSWSIELREAFPAWVGWMLPFGARMALVLDEDQDLDEILVELARVGYENIEGVLWGVERWRDAGLPIDDYGTMTARQFTELAADRDDLQVLDVRAPDEWEDGHLDGSIHCYTPDLLDGIPRQLDRDRPVYVGCTTGHRAGIAAPLLERAGYEPVVLTGASLLGVMMLSAAAA